MSSNDKDASVEFDLIVDPATTRPKIVTLDPRVVPPERSPLWTPMIESQSVSDALRHQAEDEQVFKDAGFELGPPEQLGSIPTRTELTVLPPDPPRQKPVGFMLYQVTGTDLYRLPSGYDPDTMDYSDAIAVAEPENLVTTEDGLREGDLLLVQDLMGLNIGVVSISPTTGQPLCTSQNGKMLYFLQFVSDRPAPAPPRWVCTGSGNLAAVKKLEITT